MIELLALTIVAGILAGVLFLFGGLLLLPVYLIVKILGFGFRIAFHVVGFVVVGLILLPITLILGVALFGKLLLLLLPLGFVALLVWLVATLAKTSSATPPAGTPELAPGSTAESPATAGRPDVG